MINLSKQLVAFLHGKFVVSLNPQVPTEERYLMLTGLTKELARYGYTVSKETILRLSEDDVKDIYSSVIPYLIDFYHHGEHFLCLYPNFPQDVLETPDLILKMDQQAIYEGFTDIEKFMERSWYSPEEVESVKRSHVNKEISYMTEEEFMRLPVSIMSTGMSVTRETINELSWFLDTYPELQLPNEIPFKETLCIVVSKRPEYELKEINDVLRYAMYTMGSSPSLTIVPKKVLINSWDRRKSANPEWRKLTTLSRSNRRNILSRIEAVVKTKGLEKSVVDAKKFYGHWVLLSERIHSGDYKKQFPNAVEFFKTLQTRSLSKDMRTWNSFVQEMYNSKENIVSIAEFISTRPGELIRRFDSLMRRAMKDRTEKDVEKLVDVFLETTGMKSKTLLELLSYYDKRECGCPRLVKVNGTTTELPQLKGIKPEVLEFLRDIITRKVLINIDNAVAEKDLVGKTVRIDPLIKNIPVPTDMKNRTISIPAGTRVPIVEDVVRFFVHWKQLKGRSEDLDLHAKILDENFRSIIEIGWNRNQATKSGAVAHSGDVLDRPGDCAEYIDVDFTKLTTDSSLSKGRHITIIVDNYKGRGLDTLPCWFGYSEIPEVIPGDNQWKPRDVRFCQKSVSPFSSVAAMVVDIKERELIFVDSNIKSLPGMFDQFESVTKFYTSEHSFTTFDVLSQHYKSRGATIVPMKGKEESEEMKDVKVDDTIDITYSDVVNDYTSVLDILSN